MGGPGSSRWGITVTRMTTEGLPRLDVRVLARQGALRPGTTATVTWDSGASVTTTVTTDAPDCLRLAYVVVDRRGVGRSVTARATADHARHGGRGPCLVRMSRLWPAVRDPLRAGRTLPLPGLPPSHLPQHPHSRLMILPQRTWDLRIGTTPSQNPAPR
jgi:hypothetical protein